MLSSEPLQRLRRIRQLGFGSYGHISADHSRFAHAIGTAHVMQELIKSTTTLDRIDCDEIAESLNSEERLEKAQVEDLLVISALLQDIGEMPFAEATTKFYRPTPALRDEVRVTTGVNVDNAPAKLVFTLAAISRSETLLASATPAPGAVARLIAGAGRTLGEKPAPMVATLLHMLDGTIDADRIDYVSRDSHQTLGGSVDTRALIASIEYYDEHGVVISDPEPSTQFLAQRKHLYQRVYRSPEKRLRMHLLLRVLQSLRELGKLDELAPGRGNGELDYEDFIEFDDFRVVTALSELASDTHRLRRLSHDGRYALEALSQGSVEYEDRWLPRPPTPMPPPSFEISLPPDLVYDTFADQEGVAWYQRGSVRVLSPRYKYLGQPVLLEQCAGATGKILADSHDLVPVDGAILLHLPVARRSTSWKAIERGAEEGWLYGVLRHHDPLVSFDAPFDTRALKGFTGPAIFISFAWTDIAIVNLLISQLFQLRQRYFLIAEEYQGVGDTPRNNSRNAVVEAEAAVILASVNYSSRYRDQPDGNIATELFTMHDRINSPGATLPIVALAADSHAEVRSSLPWHALGFDELPYVGEGLRNADQTQMMAAALATVEAVRSAQDREDD